MAAPSPDVINGLLARTRHAEVRETAIIYGDLDRDDVDACLRELGIIVREAIEPPDAT